MSKDNEISNGDSWQAAEHALGVLDRTQRAAADKRMQSDPAFRHDVESWQAQLSPLMDEIEDVSPPAAVWDQVEDELFRQVSVPLAEPSNGLWKLMTAFASTVAVAVFALLFYVTGGDLTGQKLETAERQVAALQSENTEDKRSLDNARNQIETLRTQVAESQNDIRVGQEALDRAREQLAEARRAVEEAQSDIAVANQAREDAELQLTEVLQSVSDTRPLVASLTQSGDVPAFVAQFDPVRKALFIRSAVSDADEKVPELWLIPNEGEDKGKALSMGVLDEGSPNTLSVDERLITQITDGGTLAITMEPPGGAPGGVATGPVIALGTLQSF